MTMHTTTEIIDRAKALEYLSHNTSNRPVSRPYVRHLADMMVNGNWYPTHQGIAFDVNGNLLDGQHRLLAIVEADAVVHMLVTWGQLPQTFSVLDQHRKRTAAQFVSHAGLTKDAPRLAAMARTILQVTAGKHRASNAETTAFAVENSEILQRYLPVARRYTPAVGAAFAWADMLGWGVEAAATRLMEKLWDRPGDPMRALDRRSESFAKLGNGETAVKQKFDLALHALHADHDGRDLQVLRSTPPNYAALKPDNDVAAAG